jgi:hypothetical protein
MINGNIEEMLSDEGVFISTTVGISMYPLLRNRRDNVIIKPVKEKLKKYDVPLYKRGDEYILHRIIGFDKNGYIIRGDNCFNKEYGITDADIIGVATGFYRGDCYFSVKNTFYILYSRLTVLFHPLKMFLRRVRGKISGILHHKK